MARKVKEIKQGQTVSEKQTNISTPAKSNIGYSGNLSIKVKLGNKIVYQKQKHNAGQSAIFDFLARCLAGSYVNDLRPKYIKLYEKGADEEPTSPDFDSDREVSILLPYTDAAKVDNADQVTYHFVIPKTSILKQSSTVYKAALFCESHKSGEPSAIYLDTEKEASSGKIVWGNGLNLKNYVTNNYNILIDWTLQLSNLNNESEA